MAINKVNYGGQTLIDTSGDTAEAGDVLAGQTFHSKSGSQSTGTLTLPEEVPHINLTQAEYDALTYEEKNNGSVYFVTDGGNCPFTSFKRTHITAGTVTSGYIASGGALTVNVYIDYNEYFCSIWGYIYISKWAYSGNVVSPEVTISVPSSLPFFYREAAGLTRQGTNANNYIDRVWISNSGNSSMRIGKNYFAASPQNNNNVEFMLFGGLNPLYVQVV